MTQRRPAGPILAWVFVAFIVVPVAWPACVQEGNCVGCPTTLDVRITGPVQVSPGRYTVELSSSSTTIRATCDLPDQACDFRPTDGPIGGYWGSVAMAGSNLVIGAARFSLDEGSPPPGSVSVSVRRGQTPIVHTQVEPPYVNLGDDECGDCYYAQMDIFAQ